MCLDGTWWDEWGKPPVVIHEISRNHCLTDFCLYLHIICCVRCLVCHFQSINSLVLSPTQKWRLMGVQVVCFFRSRSSVFAARTLWFKTSTAWHCFVKRGALPSYQSDSDPRFAVMRCLRGQEWVGRFTQVSSVYWFYMVVEWLYPVLLLH